MPRLIDLDAAIEAANQSDVVTGSSVWYTGEVIEFLEDQPTVDAVLLPCKVGSTIYETDGIRIYPSVVSKLIFDTGHIAFDESAIGKSVFLTKEEAEAALRERGGDNA